MAISATITSRSLKSRLKATVTPPTASNEMWGKLFSGCTRAKTRKKPPSSAAA
jgi:hypothetical protein